MSLARWPVVPLVRCSIGPLARWPVGQVEKRKADGRAAGWRYAREAGRLAGRQAGRQAGKLADWQATVFAAMPLRNHAAPAEDLEQGA